MTAGEQRTTTSAMLMAGWYCWQSAPGQDLVACAIAMVVSGDLARWHAENWRPLEHSSQPFQQRCVPIARRGGMSFKEVRSRHTERVGNALSKRKGVAARVDVLQEFFGRAREKLVGQNAGAQ